MGMHVGVIICALQNPLITEEMTDLALVQETSASLPQAQVVVLTEPSVGADPFELRVGLEAVLLVPGRVLGPALLEQLAGVECLQVRERAVAREVFSLEPVPHVPEGIL